MPDGGLGERIRDWLASLGELWKRPIEEWTATQAGKIIVSADEEELPPTPAIDQIMTDKALRGEMGRDDWIEWIIYHREHPSVKSRGIDILYSALTFVGWVLGVSAPSMRLATYLVDKTAHSARLDPASAIRAAWRDDTFRELRDSHLEEQGYDLDSITAMVYAMIPYLRDEQEIELWLRGELEGPDIVDRLKQKGYLDSDIANLQTLAYPIPPVPDLITMAVREVFTPEIVSKYGLMEDFPPDFAAWAEKRGLTPEWARNYWAMHWVLPSLREGYEMLHRTDFSEDDMRTLLRTQDIMPYFREYLMEISYLTLTRVDTRRMHKLGVIGPEEVFQSYINQGYDTTRARWMTEFTVKYNEGEDRELTKTVILEAYRTRSKNADWAIERLMRLDYREENARLYIALEDYEYAKETKEEYLKNYKLQYVEGLWDIATLRENLGNLALPSTEEARYIDLWTLERERRASRPTVTQLGRFYDGGIIPEQTYTEQMRFRGYSPEMIGWYVDEIEAKQRERLEKLTDKEKQVEVIKKAYPSKTELRLWLTAGIITEPRYREVLYERGYSTEFTDHYVEQIMVEELETRGLDTLEELQERKRRIAHPTRADLKAFLEVGIMTMEEIEEELALQDFHLDMIRYYIELWTAEEEE